MQTKNLVAIATIAFLTDGATPAQDWYLETPASAPAARRFHGVCFDAGRAVTVLFGGVDERSNTVFGDTWEYDGAEWSLRATGGPAARQRFASCMHRSSGMLVVFGGIAADGMTLGDTWQWDGTGWLPVLTQHAPAPRADAEMAFDESRGRIVLFGGRSAGANQPLGDTWEFDGVDWMPKSPAAAPSPRFGHAMCYDPVRGKSVLFGGFANGSSGVSADTWEYDGSSWRQVVAATVPTSLVFPALTAHRAHGVLVLTGGLGSASQPLQTLVFDGSGWQPGPAAPQALASRQGHATAYDESREAVVLFGGASIAFGGARPSADTWELSTRAAFVPFGSGCRTSAGLLELKAESRPQLGRSLQLAATPLPAGAQPLVLLGGSDRAWQGLALPLDLARVGMPGCTLLASIDVSAPMLRQWPTARAVLPIPLDRTLLGQVLYAQALLLGPEPATANAGRVLLGN